jgi:hypothetical protein
MRSAPSMAIMRSVARCSVRDDLRFMRRECDILEDDFASKKIIYFDLKRVKVLQQADFQVT